MRMRVLLSLLVVASMLTPGVDAEEASRLSDVRIAMSDGAELVGDVRFPPGDGPFPVILTMSPYGREDQTSPATLTRDFVPHGYAQANVDIRGTGKSDGTLCIFCEREQQDVYEVVEWMGTQPWSDGNVGMTGVSYLGISQLLGAAKHPPHLKAIVPEVPYADTYRDIVWHNGIWNQFFMTQWTGLQAALGFQGAAESQDLAARADNHLAVSFKDHPFDGPIYHERSVYPKYDLIEVPTLLVSGWFDGFSRGTVRNFQGIASEHKRLVMGPRAHTGTGAPFDPASPYAPEAAIPGDPDPILDWFDRWLRGVDNGAESKPAVSYFDLGAHEWRFSDTWPPSDAGLSDRYLSGAPSGSAASLNDGSLALEVPTGADAAPDSYVYDPSVGVTETASKWSNVAAGPHVRLPQGPDEARQLTYTTEELTEPLSLAGPMELRFFGETDASDTDWIVKVTDVAPDGTSLIMTSGYLRASHREVDEARSKPAEPWIANTRALPVPADTPVEYRIDIWPIAYELQPGHRLRIQVASADTPSHEPLWEAATNTIHHSAELPATLTLTLR